MRLDAQIENVCPGLKMEREREKALRVFGHERWTIAIVNVGLN